MSERNKLKKSDFLSIEVPDWFLALLCSSYHAIENWLHTGFFSVDESLVLGFLVSILLMTFRAGFFLCTLRQYRTYGVFLTTGAVLMTASRYNFSDEVLNPFLSHFYISILSFAVLHFALHFIRQGLKNMLKESDAKLKEST